ncbi:MAG: TonB-dependent receptor plug domain-containing protein, partial [Thermodesulfobacteriota bacterium]|nr:TonB-dependent receptor plug domain-containing protein [Thermodesulfobacteriota bacterium]
MRFFVTGFCIISLFISGLLFAPATYAQPEEGAEAKAEEEAKTKAKANAEEKEEPVKLGDVIVTAFHGGAVTITPTKTIIDIEKFSKAGSVDRIEDILRHVAGIDVLRGSTGADPQQFIMMRGFDDSRFTVAFDGRSITSPSAGADTYVDWSSLTTADIEKVEIIRGASSALYGNSQGGIINIITKKGKKRDTLVPKVTFKSDYSRFDTYAERATLDGGVGNFGYFFNYGYKKSDGYLRNNYYRGGDYSTRLSYYFPSEANLTLSWKGSYLDHGYAVVNDPGLASYDPDYPVVPVDADTIRRYREISYPGGDNLKEKESDHVDIMFEQPIKDATLNVHLFMTRGAEDSWFYVYSGDQPIPYDPPPEDFSQKFSGDEDREETQWGGTIRYDLHLWENNSLTVGYDHRRMQIESAHNVWRMHAGYFEDNWTVTPRLSMILGL